VIVLVRRLGLMSPKGLGLALKLPRFRGQHDYATC
jgi:hypothetical protein